MYGDNLAFGCLRAIRSTSIRTSPVKGVVTVETRSKKPSRTTLAIAGLILLLVLAAFEYSQVAELESQNRNLRTENQSLSAQASYASINSSLVFQAWLSHLDKIQSGNISEALTDYAQYPTMSWSGYSNGMGGNYIGVAEINLTLQTFSARMTSLHFTVESFNSTVYPNGTRDIGAFMAFTGSKSSIGTFNGTLSAKYQYVYQGGKWLISQEDWNFESFFTEYAVEIF